MIHKLGEKFSDLFQKYMPDAFVFAMILTLITALSAFFWVGSTPLEIISSWYDGFWNLLEFGMQIILMIVTGYSIAMSPIVKKAIDKLPIYIKTPGQVYLSVIIIGSLLSLVSFGWIIITSVLARELAIRIKGVNYPYLIACVYIASGNWVCGLSSSIPLLLNTKNNYLIETGILSSTISTSNTLGSYLNFAVMIILFSVTPVAMLLLLPKNKSKMEMSDLMESKNLPKEISIKEEALTLNLPSNPLSDRLNNSNILQYIIGIMGLTYIIYHFSTNGLDLNFNIMIFIFLIIGLFLHKTPIRYGISMKRASSNISGILFQYPFYAGIMGIMTFTGLGEKLAFLLASMASIESFPFYAYLTGGILNFAIPSAGGEFAVIGPSIINAVKEIGAGVSDIEMNALISRASLSIAYGESLTNLLQPFFLLLVLPVMGAGIKIQARDVMGYLVIPFFVLFLLEIFLVSYLPI